MHGAGINITPGITDAQKYLAARHFQFKELIATFFSAAGTDFTDSNIRVQSPAGLPPSLPLKDNQPLDFTVEMETGTGKTYVYLRSVFELNQRYGFTKFVVVVPSVAIKEGVNKTLQITREHFENLYPAAKGYEFFQYDSDKLGQVRNFATSPNIQIMVITVGAINKFGDEAAAQAEESDEAKRREKSKNKMYRASEKTGGERPIDLIRQTSPILIVDEPQSVDGGIDGKGKRALAHMSPLCTLRYSATHVDKHHMVYRLDAVDAYEQRLVKQIEVAAATVQGGNNKPYVKLLAINNKRGVITASIEVDRENSAGVVRRDAITVQDGFDLEQEAVAELDVLQVFVNVLIHQQLQRIANTTALGELLALEALLSPGTTQSLSSDRENRATNLLAAKQIAHGLNGVDLIRQVGFKMQFHAAS